MEESFSRPIPFHEIERKHYRNLILGLSKSVLDGNDKMKLNINKEIEAAETNHNISRQFSREFWVENLKILSDAAQKTLDVDLVRFILETWGYGQDIEVLIRTFNMLINNYKMVELILNNDLETLEDLRYSISAQKTMGAISLKERHRLLGYELYEILFNKDYDEFKHRTEVLHDLLSEDKMNSVICNQYDCNILYEIDENITEEWLLKYYLDKLEGDKGENILMIEMFRFAETLPDPLWVYIYKFYADKSSVELNYLDTITYYYMYRAFYSNIDTKELLGYYNSEESIQNTNFREWFERLVLNQV